MTQTSPKQWNALPKVFPVIKDEPTAIVYIGDMSGSMSGLTTDTIGGFNQFMENQAKLPGETYVTVVLFNTEVITLAEHQLINELPLLTNKEYIACGGTALVDAVGEALDRLERNPPKGRVLVVIDTDGQENSSKRYKTSQVKAKIENLTAAGWGFVYLGADASAWEGAASIGVQNVGHFSASPVGVTTKYQNLNATTNTLRRSSASFAATAGLVNYNTVDTPPPEPPQPTP